MGLGDEVIAAGQAQRLFDTTGYCAVIVDKRNRARWHDLWTGNPVIVKPNAQGGGVYEPHQPLRTRTIQNGSDCRPYIVYPFSEQTGWTFNREFRCREHIGKLYLTPAELALGPATRQLVGGDYIVIEPHSKRPNVRWPLAHWTRLVADAPDLTFVQPVWGEAPRVPGAVHVPATFREACGLLAGCAIFVSGEGGLHHAAAALGVRALAIWGGCLDWQVLGGYPRQTGIEIAQPPCGRWLRCDHCAEIMQAISPPRVLNILRAALAEGRVESSPCPV